MVRRSIALVSPFALMIAGTLAGCIPGGGDDLPTVHEVDPPMADAGMPEIPGISLNVRPALPHGPDAPTDVVIPPPLPPAERPAAWSIYRPRATIDGEPTLTFNRAANGVAGGSFRPNNLYQLVSYAPNQGDAVTLRSSAVAGEYRILRAMNDAGVMVTATIPALRASKYFLPDSDSTSEGTLFPIDSGGVTGADVRYLGPRRGAWYGMAAGSLVVIDQGNRMFPWVWPNWQTGDFGQYLPLTEAASGVAWREGRVLAGQLVHTECYDVGIHAVGYVRNEGGEVFPAIWAYEMTGPNIGAFRLTVLDTPGGAQGVAIGVDARSGGVIGYYCTEAGNACIGRDLMPEPSHLPEPHYDARADRRATRWEATDWSFNVADNCSAAIGFTRTDFDFSSAGLDCDLGESDPTQGYRLHMTNVNYTGQYAVAVAGDPSLANACGDRILFYSPGDDWTEVRLPPDASLFRRLVVTGVDDTGNVSGFRAGAELQDKVPLYLEAIHDASVEFTPIELAGLARGRNYYASSSPTEEARAHYALVEKIPGGSCEDVSCGGDLSSWHVVDWTSTCLNRSCTDDTFPRSAGWGEAVHYSFSNTYLMRSDREYFLAACHTQATTPNVTLIGGRPDIDNGSTYFPAYLSTAPGLEDGGAAVCARLAAGLSWQ